MKQFDKPFWREHVKKLLLEIRHGAYITPKLERLLDLMEHSYNEGANEGINLMQEFMKKVKQDFGKMNS